MNPNRSPAWARKLIVLLCLLLLLTALGIGYWVRALRDRNWSALLARVEELTTATAVPPPLPARLAMGRTLVPGNAWDDYLKANIWVPGKPPENIGYKIGPYLHRQPKADRAEMESLLNRFSGSIDLISKGARRLEARAPAKMDHDIWNINPICVLRARFLAEEGTTTEALELLIDECVHARDLAHTSLYWLTGIQLLLGTFREIRDVLQSREVSKEDLLTLERRLQLLDENFPGLSRGPEQNLIDLGNLLIREDRDDRIYLSYSNQERYRRTWRTLFSSRLQAASSFSKADQLVRRALEARKLPWPEQHAALLVVSREMDALKDPLLDSISGSLQDSQIRYQALAALRLLRIAAHYRATGSILELEDPLGGTVRTMASDGTLIAWHLPPWGGSWTPKKGAKDYWITMSIEVRRP